MLLRLYLRVPPVVVQGTSVPGFVHLHLFVIGDVDVVLVLAVPLFLRRGLFIPGDAFNRGLKLVPDSFFRGFLWFMSDRFCPRVNFFVTLVNGFV